MRKLLTFYLFALLAFGVGRAADETVTFSEQGYSNGAAVESYSGTNFSITFAKGTNSNAPKYYSSGSAIRAYGGNTFTVSSTTKTISKIEITFGTGGDSNEITTDVNTYSSGTWTGEASSVTFTVGGSSGNRRLSAIAVTYKTSTVVTVDAPTFNLTGGATYNEAKTLTMSCATTGATIRYNLSSTAPTSTTGTLYSEGLTFDTNGEYTVTAVAFKDGTASQSSTITFAIDIPTATTDEEATFIFNTDAGLAALGVTKPSSGNATNLTNMTLTSEDVSFTSTDGGTATRVWNSNGTLDLRVYSGATITLSVPTTPSGYSITKVVIAGSSLGSLSATGYSNGTWNGDATSVTFTASGTVKINTITVTYTKPGGSTPVTYTEVTGLAAFKALDAGNTVKLVLPDANNVRVLHVKSNSNGTSDVYIRDNTGGALLMQGFSPNRAMSYGQHLAGWLVGTYNVNSDGMALFVPESGVTHTAFLVIADPVSEAAVEPKEITASDVSDNLADWVLVKDVESGVTLQNAFSTSYIAPYSGAIVDVSAIAASSGTVYPVSHNEVPVITYVLDSSKNFTSPSSAISGATVRVKRSLTAGKWSPLTLPFDYSGFNGTVQQYDNLTASTTTGPVSGNTFAAGQMNFMTVTEMEAGVPYMVKPSSSITEFTASNVTLTTTEAGSVTHHVSNGSGQVRALSEVTSSDNYSFVGVYSPTTLQKDQGYKLMNASGDIVWASDEANPTVEGSSAYFQTPADQGLLLKMQGESGVITGIDTVVADERFTSPEGIYNILGVKMPDDWQQLPPGLYIVNGVKTIKR